MDLVVSLLCQLLFPRSRMNFQLQPLNQHRQWTEKLNITFELPWQLGKEDWVTRSKAPAQLKKHMETKLHKGKILLYQHKADSWWVTPVMVTTVCECSKKQWKGFTIALKPAQSNYHQHANVRLVLIHLCAFKAATLFQHIGDTQ